MLKMSTLLTDQPEGWGGEPEPCFENITIGKDLKICYLKKTRISTIIILFCVFLTRFLETF